jgi:hypothetical protein
MKTLVLALAFCVLLLTPLPTRAGHRGGGGGQVGGHGSARFGDFHGGFDHRRLGGGFYYPSCFCPYYGCAGTEGYWIDQPYIGPDGSTRFQRQWIPAVC